MNFSKLYSSKYFVSGTILLISLSHSALSWAQDSLATELVTCSFMQDRSERFSCYEVLAKKTQIQLQQRSRTQQAAPEAVDKKTVAVASKPPQRPPEPPVNSSTPTPIESNPIPTTNESTNVFEVVLQKAERNAYDDWLLYFDNGEVWKQIDSRRRRMPELPAKATVTRGNFGSHRLRVDGRSWSMKIKKF